MIPPPPLDLHPETGLVALGPLGVLNAGGPVPSDEDDLPPEPPAEGPWWSKTWTRACGPVVTRAGLQSQGQTGLPGSARQILW